MRSSYFQYPLLQIFLQEYFHTIRYIFQIPFRYIHQSFLEFAALQDLENHFELTNDVQTL